MRREIFDKYFTVIEDWRSQCDVKHKLNDVLILVMCAALSGIDELTGVVDYGEEKMAFLKEAFGIEMVPSVATLSRIMSVVDAGMLATCIVGIMREMVGGDGDVIALDGKAVRSTQKAGCAKEKLHIVTAYLTANGVCLGQLAVDEKTNEIPIVRELVRMLNIKGKTLTMDALHCQKDTVGEIIGKGGDYVIGLKENQKLLHDDIALYMEDCLEDKHACVESASTSEKNRDRLETRVCRKAPDISWLACKDDWPGLRNAYSVQRRTVVAGRTMEETSYYITSLDASCEEILRIVREHWKIESMHWMLDVVFSEDDCRILSANGQKSMNVFRKLALALQKQYISQIPQKTKPSTRKNMLRCLMNDDLLLDVIRGYAIA